LQFKALQPSIARYRSLLSVEPFPSEFQPRDNLGEALRYS